MKRYDLYVSGPGDLVDSERGLGEWVRYSDVSNILARLKAVELMNQQFIQGMVLTPPVDEVAEFDEKAAIEQACRGTYFTPESVAMMQADKRLGSSRIAFIDGARWMWNQMRGKNK